ncbi:MAG: CTP synthase [Cyanobacteria bacterium J06635_15]
MKPAIAILGEYKPNFEPHIATTAAITHSSSQLKTEVVGNWVSTEDITPSLFEQYSGIWVAPGSPYKNMEKMLWAIQYARENNVPCFGTCGGFQHMILEYARHVLGFQKAESEDNNPYASQLFITQLACSLAGREMQLTFTEGSRISEIYGAQTATEQYYCNFGVNPDYVPLLKQRSLQITGADCEGDVRVIELPSHPFFIGTLFVPQARSTPEVPHPIVTAFLRAVTQYVPI